MNAIANHKIIIVTTGHPARDERLLHKFGVSLQRAGCRVTVFTTLESTDDEAYGVRLHGEAMNHLSKKEKTARITAFLHREAPDAVIAAEPLAVYAAAACAMPGGKPVPVIYDVTEWYPELLTSKIRSLRKIPVYAAGYVLNMLCARKASAFIFGEDAKGMRYRRAAPKTPWITIGYYPNTDFIVPAAASGAEKPFTVGYSGILNSKRGFFRFLDVLECMQGMLPKEGITGLVTGDFESTADEEAFRQRQAQGLLPHITMRGRVAYEGFSAAMAEADICLDLREKDFIYANSLPIKIFDYLAMGKPVVYTDIAPIRNFFGNSLPGLLVDPGAAQATADAIVSRYVKSPGTLLKERQRALMLAETYRWSRIEGEFLSFTAGVIARAKRI